MVGTEKRKLVERVCEKVVQEEEEICSIKDNVGFNNSHNQC